MMRGWLVGMMGLVLAGCSHAQDTILAQANSSDGWTVLAQTRHGKLTTGYNDIVIAVQDPMHAWLPPNDVTVTMTMTPTHPNPSQTPSPVEMQPDGENGHWLAIAELPHPDTWTCNLNVSHKAVSHRFSFNVQN